MLIKKYLRSILKNAGNFSDQESLRTLSNINLGQIFLRLFFCSMKPKWFMQVLMAIILITSLASCGGGGTDGTGIESIAIRANFSDILGRANTTIDLRTNLSEERTPNLMSEDSFEVILLWQADADIFLDVLENNEIVTELVIEDIPRRTRVIDIAIERDPNTLDFFIAEMFFTSDFPS